MLEQTTPNQIFSNIGKTEFKPTWQGPVPAPDSPLAPLHGVHQKILAHQQAAEAEIARLRADTTLDPKTRAERESDAVRPLLQYLAHEASEVALRAYNGVQRRWNEIVPRGAATAEIQAAATRLAALPGPERFDALRKAALGNDAVLMSAALLMPKESGFAALQPDSQNTILKRYRRKAAPDVVAEIQAFDQAAARTVTAMTRTARAASEKHWRLKPLVAALESELRKIARTPL